jgi:hypothetical protein
MALPRNRDLARGFKKPLVFFAWRSLVCPSGRVASAVPPEAVVPLAPRPLTDRRLGFHRRGACKAPPLPGRGRPWDTRRD